VDILALPNITPEESHWATELIGKQMLYMTRLVDDLLDVSRISQDRLELRKERIDLAAVVQRAVEMNRPAIKQSSHELTMTLPAAPIYVHGDEVRLAQVFSNLLNNAAKYTDQGGAITLAVAKNTSDVLVTVKDNGIGIAPDQLARVFEMFAQIDRSMERTQGGLGIGLNLAKRLVEMHGGTIAAKSAGLGKGSEFAVRLPIMVEASEARVAPPGTRVAMPASAAAILRILVVDDNRDSAETLEMMLRHRGNTVSLAYDGEAAVQAALELQPDVVVLDIGLPKLNGDEACRRIRQQTTGRRIIIIALTGWSRDEDRQLTREAGFDYHLVKPVSPNAVWTLIADLASKRND
jgi:CheY-like chemotaxis protein